MDNIFSQYSNILQVVMRPIALKFVLWLSIIGGLEFALWYLPKFIERRRGEAAWEKFKKDYEGWI